VAVEQRLVRCEHCGKGIVLSYQRALIGQRLRSSIITTTQVPCPWSGCGRLQQVVVPLEGQAAAVAVWLGQQRLPPAVTEESRAVRAFWAAQCTVPLLPTPGLFARWRAFLRRRGRRALRRLFVAIDDDPRHGYERGHRSD
jgi:hypothetical protein